MKKMIAFALAVLLAALAGCGKAEEAACYVAVEDVTIRTLLELTTPENILERIGGVRVDYSYENTGDDNLDQSKTWLVYAKEGEYIHCNQMADYPNDAYTHLYFTNDPADAMLYLESNGGKDVSPISEEELKGAISESFLSYGYYTDAQIVSAAEENGIYTLVVEVPDGDAVALRDTLTMEAATGFVTKIREEHFENGAVTSTLEQTLTYSDDLTVDRSAKENTSVQVRPEAGDTLTFSTVDIDGERVTDEILREAKVVMVNFWEPWCGPCVGEMPELQELYENYKEQGLLILGVFSTVEETDEAKAILEQKGITYPILVCDANLAQFTSDYVPTTVFTDGEGHVLSAEPVIGAQDYAAWEAMVQEYLK